MIHAILTGHSRGLGAALAEQLLDRGASVLGIARRGNAALAARHPALREIALDLSDTSSLLRWLSGPSLKHFLQGAGQVLLINNAGLLQPVGPVGTQDPETIARSVALNVAAPMLLSNAVAAATSAPCRVLHISSGVGHRPCAGWSVYAATKAALDHHARCAGLDVTPKLAIASLAPGVVDTDMQAEIRASDPAKFPPLAQFLKLQSDHLLVSPADTAAKVLAYLLAENFPGGAVADVREL
jgi:NAD(P)-dependent dehydrogenase (short-subunit alcohol dehydrogenase family)